MKTGLRQGLAAAAAIAAPAFLYAAGGLRPALGFFLGECLGAILWSWIALSVRRSLAQAAVVRHRLFARHGLFFRLLAAAVFFGALMRWPVAPVWAALAGFAFFQFPAAFFTASAPNIASTSRPRQPPDE